MGGRASKGALARLTRSETRSGLGDPESGLRQSTTPSRKTERLGPWNRAALEPTRARNGARDGQLHMCVTDVRGRADTQADMLLAEASSAICVQRFDDSRTVQVTLRIAFRCVLHRCESQDIRC